MPRSNPLARERVKDDRKHLDSRARPFPFAGRGTSGESPAGSSHGSALQAPGRTIGDHEVLERRRVGALFQCEEPPLGPLGPCRRTKPLVRAADSSRARLALFGDVGSNVDAREAPERRATSLRSPAWPRRSFTGRRGLRGGSRRFVAGGPGRAPARSAGAARNRPFQGSCSRSYRCGRIGRTASSSWKRADRETGAARGSETQSGHHPDGAIVARPMKGAPDHQTRAVRHGTARRGDLGHALAGTSSRERGASSRASEEEGGAR